MEVTTPTPCSLARICLVASAVYVLSKAQLEAGLESLNIARFLLSSDSFAQPSVPAPHEPFETAHGGTEYLMRATSSNLVSVIAYIIHAKSTARPAACKYAWSMFRLSRMQRRWYHRPNPTL